MIHAVTVVPILMPNSKPMDWDTLSKPALTKPTIKTVEPDEDWISEVMMKPVDIAKNLLLVILSRKLRSADPAAR